MLTRPICPATNRAAPATSRATGAAFFGPKVHRTFADPSSPHGRRVPRTPCPPDSGGRSTGKRSTGPFLIRSHPRQPRPDYERVAQPDSPTPPDPCGSGVRPFNRSTGAIDRAKARPRLTPAACAFGQSDRVTRHWHVPRRSSDSTCHPTVTDPCSNRRTPERSPT